MKNNCSDDINKLIEIPDIIVKSIESKEKGVIIHGECIEESRCPNCGHEKLERYNSIFKFFCLENYRIANDLK